MACSKIMTPADLATFRAQARQTQTGYRARVLICMTGCRALGAADICQTFRDKLQAAGLQQEVAVVAVGCLGKCARAPLLLIEPQEYLYGCVKPADVDEIIDVTLRQGRPVERLCETVDGQVRARMSEVPFYAAQRREVLRHCGRIDPKRIADAVAVGSYAAAAKVLTTMTPEQTIKDVIEAGLRGRGGAGFPTGTKWDLCRKAPGAPKYLICNADEGDPGAFMDRALLEGVPHQVIEGMIIGAYAIGATAGFVYVRAEYPIAVEHVGLALQEARAAGLLGKNILGTGMDFDIEVRMGAGAFVCGEESALIASLEGRRGMPRPRPPFPVQSGYLGKPTCINNVETFGNVPFIFDAGKATYAGIGTNGSKGTKIFALAGKVKDTGLIEAPMGASLRQLVFEIGGGVPDGGTFKAAQMGGPSGGCVPAQYLDLPVDFDSVKAIGAIMGSGGLIVMDDNTCMVDMARYFMDFVQKESCGKCVPCRIGTRHMLDVLKRICAGEGRPDDIGELEQIAKDVKANSLCGLGQTAPNPVLTTLRYFKDEYEEHIREHRCRAHVCPGLFQYQIVDADCIGCGACRKACPKEAISGEPKKPHVIDQQRCVFCGACFSVCPKKAVKKI